MNYCRKVHATTSERDVGSFKFLTSDNRKIVHSGKAVCKLITRKQNDGSTAKVLEKFSHLLHTC